MIKFYFHQRSDSKYILTKSFENWFAFEQRSTRLPCRFQNKNMPSKRISQLFCQFTEPSEAIH